MKTFHHDIILYREEIFDLPDGIHVDKDGDIFYIKDFGYHRKDGPAAIEHGVVRGWYLNGKCHRADGPAKIWDNGNIEWWWNDKQYRSIERWAEAAGIYDTDDFTMVKLEWG